MNKSFNKFLLIGAATFGLAGNVMAGISISSDIELPKEIMEAARASKETGDEMEAQLKVRENLQNIKLSQTTERNKLQQEISNRLGSILKDNLNKKLVTQQPIFKVDVIESTETLQKNNEVLKNAGLSDISGNLLHANFSFEGNASEIKEDSCHVNVTYDDKGNMVPLEEASDNLFKSVSFQNQQQREMAQEFIFLHESYHCEFSKIENPVRIAGESKEFNESLNYTLKDQKTMIPAKRVSYIDTLNETFADVGASLMMQMKYGKDETTKKDFMFVMDVVKTERHSSYFQQTYDPHMTHFALNHVFDKENLIQLDRINANVKTQPDLMNAKELRDLAFDIANKGILELVANNENMRKAMLSPEGINDSIVANAAAMIFVEKGPKELSKSIVFHAGFAPEISNGVSYDLGKEVASKMNGNNYFKEDGSMRANLKNMQPDILKTINNNDLSPKMIQKLEESKKTMKKLEEHAVKQYSPSDFDSISVKEPLNKNLVSSKIASMREAFTKRNNETINSPIMK